MGRQRADHGLFHLGGCGPPRRLFLLLLLHVARRCLDESARDVAGQRNVEGSKDAVRVPRVRHRDGAVCSGQLDAPGDFPPGWGGGGGGVGGVSRPVWLSQPHSGLATHMLAARSRWPVASTLPERSLTTSNRRRRCAGARRCERAGSGPRRPSRTASRKYAMTRSVVVRTGYRTRRGGALAGGMKRPQASMHSVGNCRPLPRSPHHLTRACGERGKVGRRTGAESRSWAAHAAHAGRCAPPSVPGSAPRWRTTSRGGRRRGSRPGGGPAQRGAGSAPRARPWAPGVGFNSRISHFAPSRTLAPFRRIPGARWRRRASSSCPATTRWYSTPPVSFWPG